MLICIDSCVFIRGITQPRSDARQLLDLIGTDIRVAIHRVIVLEVVRNLGKPEDLKLFFSLFDEHSPAFIVENLIPSGLVESYIARGLREKGDAYIGAFAEWLRVDYLISDNRHFLNELRTDAYRLLTPAEFLEVWRARPSS
jgi:hypothetical protein